MTDFEISDDVRSFFEGLSDPEPEAVLEVTAENPVIEDPAPVVEEPVVEPVVEPTTPEITPEITPETPVDPPVVEDEELHPAEVARRQQQAIYDAKMQELQNQIAQQNLVVQQQYEWNQQVFRQQQEAALAQQQAAQQQAQQESLHVDPEVLDRAMQNDLRQTFAWVAQNRPDLVPTVINKVRTSEHPNAQMQADAMQVEYSQFTAQRAAQAAQQQMQQALEAQAQQFAPSEQEQVEGTMQQIVDHLEAKHGETFKALGPEIEAKAAEMGPAYRQYLAQNGIELTPQAIADFMTQIYFDVREQKLAQVASQPRQAVELQPTQHVENPGAAFEQAMTPDDDAINEILKGAEALGIGVTQASV